MRRIAYFSFRAVSLVVTSAVVVLATVRSAAGQAFTFTTNDPDGKMAMASRPDSAGKNEIETADDFILTAPTSILGGTFTGLLPAGASVGGVRVEIYRVFPNDSNTTRTPQVPTRTNSPADVAFKEFDSTMGQLDFVKNTLNASFTAANSVQPGGIHPSPNQTTGGNGAVSGAEVQFAFTLSAPFTLPADHYFFIPQVQVNGTGDFLWLSAPKPIVAPGTPFTPDLQAWTRDSNLDPDWLRVGTDIVGGATPPTFNGAFSLDGTVVPEPASCAAIAIGCVIVAARRRR